MADKPLWSDDKINSLTFKNANNLDPDVRWMHEQIVKDMRNDYERAIALRNQASMQAAESIKDLLGRITELERQGEKREAELIKQVDIVIDLQQYITELEQRRADLAADIPTITHNAELPQYDPVWVRTLWQAYNELQAAQQWQPVKAESGAKVEMFTDGRVVVLDEDGLYYVYDLEHSEHCMGFGLPDGYAICKVQP